MLSGQGRTSKRLVLQPRPFIRPGLTALGILQQSTPRALLLFPIFSSAAVLPQKYLCYSTMASTHHWRRRPMVSLRICHPNPPSPPFLGLFSTLPTQISTISYPTYPLSLLDSPSTSTAAQWKVTLDLPLCTSRARNLNVDSMEGWVYLLIKSSPSITLLGEGCGGRLVRYERR